MGIVLDTRLNFTVLCARNIAAIEDEDQRRDALDSLNLDDKTMKYVQTTIQAMRSSRSTK